MHSQRQRWRSAISKLQSIDQTPNNELENEEEEEVSSGGNIRPAGHIRPAKANFFSFDFAFLTEMWPARH